MSFHPGATSAAETLIEPCRFEVFTENTLERIPRFSQLDSEQQFAMRVVSRVLPFRVNRYVIEELIDWHNVPEDPIFQLTFPQRGMLSPEQFDRIADLLMRDTGSSELEAQIRKVRLELNPHPAEQQLLNVPTLDGTSLTGFQHKYKETVLFFPSQGQTCHTFCTFCFRWAQFVGDRQLQFASRETDVLHRYLAEHREVSDLLVTGGDPMVMKTRLLAGYLGRLLRPEFDHIETIRIGTKALTFWPHRFVSDPDADDLLRLLEKLIKGGKHVSLMAHYNHWGELESSVAHEAIRRIRDTGTVIRTQGPLLAHINDCPTVWSRLWRTQVGLGMIPYYMFIQRDTGARRYFEVSLKEAWKIHREAIRDVSGLSRTARGPSMSAGPGKVEIQGVSKIHGEKVFVLRFIQGRNPEWVQRPFFARYDSEATWLDHLKPTFGEKEFFFEEEYRKMLDDSA